MAHGYLFCLFCFYVLQKNSILISKLKHLLGSDLFKIKNQWWSISLYTAPKFKISQMSDLMCIQKSPELISEKIDKIPTSNVSYLLDWAVQMNKHQRKIIQQIKCSLLIFRSKGPKVQVKLLDCVKLFPLNVFNTPYFKESGRIRQENCRNRRLETFHV